VSPRTALATIAVTALLASACASGEVELQVRFGEAIDLARLASLHITVGGDDDWKGDVVANDRVRAEREARLIYRAGVDSGSLDFTVEARDDADVPFADGSTTVVLHSDRRTRALVKLAPIAPTPPPDMGDDMPVTDGGVPDLPDGAMPASSCAGATTYLKCEDFETPFGSRWTTVDDPPWATATLSTARAYRGASSLRISGEAWSADLGPNRFTNAFLVPPAVLPHPTLFFRAWVYAPASSAGGQETTILTLRQTADPFEVLGLGWSGTQQLHYGWAGGSRDSTTPLPTNRWVCLEWSLSHQLGDGGALQMRAWLDGVEVPDLTVSDAPRTVPYGRVEVGVYKLLTASTPALELYVDEVVLHTQRIGCD
jgi:hypothetical protein